jgi:hypothetical protein
VGAPLARVKARLAVPPVKAVMLFRLPLVATAPLARELAFIATEAVTPVRLPFAINAPLYPPPLARQL